MQNERVRKATDVIFCNGFLINQLHRFMIPWLNVCCRPMEGKRLVSISDRFSEDLVKMPCCDHRDLGSTCGGGLKNVFLRALTIRPKFRCELPEISMGKWYRLFPVWKTTIVRA